MKRTVLLLFAFVAFPASVFCGDRHIAVERDEAVWVANLDGTGERKIAAEFFPRSRLMEVASHLTQRRNERKNTSIWTLSC